VSDERARLFVALELPGELRAALVQWRGEALAGRGSGPSALAALAAESLHVTLCFLGSVPVGAAETIGTACVRAVAGLERIALSLGPVVWLPLRRPRVLGVRVADPSGALGRLQGGLAGALSRDGWYEPEERPFLAHVTVARAAGRGGVRSFEPLAPPTLAFAGERVTLFRSRLGGAGPHYEPLLVTELGSGRY
jgi:2'-5' RNA ligase